jgi:hypothetical protein
MIWKAFKFLISAVCLFIATLVMVIEPLNFINVGFACFFVFLAAVLWIDFTKPQDSQNTTKARHNLAKTAIWGLVTIFIAMFISSFFTDNAHVNSRGFVQIITALLTAL